MEHYLQWCWLKIKSFFQWLIECCIKNQDLEATNDESEILADSGRGSMNPEIDYDNKKIEPPLEDSEYSQSFFYGLVSCLQGLSSNIYSFFSISESEDTKIKAENERIKKINEALKKYLAQSEIQEIETQEIDKCMKEKEDLLLKKLEVLEEQPPELLSTEKLINERLRLIDRSCILEDFYTMLGSYPILTSGLQDVREIDMATQVRHEHHKKVIEMFSYYMEIMKQDDVEIMRMKS